MKATIAAVLILVAGGAHAGPPPTWQDVQVYPNGIPTLEDMYGNAREINRQRDLEHYQYESLRQQRRTNQLLRRQVRALERARYVPQHRPPVDAYPGTCIVGCTLSK